jgi:3-oxo-5-alpha-steroid 4-dehydrogenase 1
MAPGLLAPAAAAAARLADPHSLAVIMLAAGAAVFATLMLWVPAAPYGRYAAGKSAAWGGPLPARTAWFFQEMPSLAAPALWIALCATPAQRARLAEPRAAARLIAFAVHYAHRIFVYPLRLRGGTPTPAGVAALAAAFCTVNGVMHAAHLAAAPPRAPTPAFWACLGLWALGFVGNLRADAALRRLRAPRGAGRAKGAVGGYRIPRGGLFEYVSAANYTAEMFEWAAWALAAQSLPAAAFAAFTFANLAPRGARHHAFYRARFPRYPRTRHAVVPFLW